jgi:hypothetical protein
MQDKPQPQPPVELTESGPSTLSKIGTAALTTGMTIIPIAVTAGAGYFGVKIVKLNLDTAKLNNATAKIAAGIK